MNKILIIITFCVLISCKKDKKVETINTTKKFTYIENFLFDFSSTCKDTIIPDLPEINQGYKFSFDSKFINWVSFNPNNPNELLIYSSTYSINEDYKTIIYQRNTMFSNILNIGQLKSKPKWGRNNWILLSKGDIYKIKENGDSLQSIVKGYGQEWNYDATKFICSVYDETIENYKIKIYNFENSTMEDINYIFSGNYNWQNKNNKITYSGVGLCIADLNNKTNEQFLELTGSGNPVWINENEIVYVLDKKMYKLNISTNTITTIANLCPTDFITILDYSPISNELIGTSTHWKSLGDDKIKVTTSIVVLNLNTNKIEFLEPNY